MQKYFTYQTVNSSSNSCSFNLFFKIINAFYHWFLFNWPSFLEPLQIRSVPKDPKNKPWGTDMAGSLLFIRRMPYALLLPTISVKALRALQCVQVKYLIRNFKKAIYLLTYSYLLLINECSYRVTVDKRLFTISVDDSQQKVR